MTSDLKHDEMSSRHEDWAGRRLALTLVSETYPPDINGVATTLQRLVGSLRERGHTVDLVCPRNGAPRELGVNALEVPGLGLPFYREITLGLPQGRRLEARWRERRPDLVHIATEGPLGWSALGSARRLGIPVTTSLHTNFHSYARHYGAGWLQRPVLSYLRAFHNRSRLTFIPTPEQQAELAAAGFERLHVLGRGVDTHLFNPARRDTALRASWGAAESTPVALYVGRLAREKNLDLFARAVQVLRAQVPALIGVVVGDGPERERLARQHPELVLAGAQRGESLARHYASADLFLFPSMTETFGNVVPEAMASGLAVLGFDYAATHALVEPQVSGLSVPVGDEAAFLKAAPSLLDETLRERLRRGAVEAARALDWSRVCDQFEQALLLAAVQTTDREMSDERLACRDSA